MDTKVFIPPDSDIYSYLVDSGLEGNNWISTCEETPSMSRSELYNWYHMTLDTVAIRCNNEDYFYIKGRLRTAYYEIDGYIRDTVKSRSASV